MNNRLLCPPHDPANIRVLNQLNLQARRSHKNDVIGTGWLPPPPEVPSHLSDLNPRSVGDKSSNILIGKNNNVVTSKSQDKNSGANVDVPSVNSGISCNTEEPRKLDVSQNSCNHNQSSRLL